MLPLRRVHRPSRAAMGASFCALAITAFGAESTPALQTLAGQVADATVAGHPESPLALALEAPTPALTNAFSTLVLARLAAAGFPAEPLAQRSDLEGAARSAGARSLLRLALTLSGGELQVRGDLLGVAENFWAGRGRPRESTSSAVIALRIPADDAARLLASEAPAHLPSVAVAHYERTAWARVEGRVVALAIGDVDGDGKPEVLVLTENAVSAFSAEGKLLATRLLEAGRSGSAPRMPFGALALLSAPPRIVARLAQQERAELLTFNSRGGRFESVSAPEQRGVQLGGGQLLLRADFVPGETLFAPSVEGHGERWTLRGPWVSAAAPSSASGGRGLFILADGSVELRGTAEHVPEGFRLGAGAAWADLDGDGHAELVVSAPEPEPAPEILRVLSWPQAVPLAQWEVGGAIRQIASGDLDHDGAEEIIVAVSRGDGGSTLERIRRSSR